MGRSTRERMLDSAARLFREHGYNGTGFRDIVKHSQAPRGSIYHYFPGGKAQLGVETVVTAGDFITALFAKGVDADDFVVGFQRFWGWWIDFIEADDFQAGCPIVGVAVEAHPEAPELAAAAAQVFADWERSLAASLRRAGVTDDADALGLASLIISSLEGATVMSRAAGNRAPLERTGQQLAALLRSRLRSEMSGARNRNQAAPRDDPT